MSLKIDCENNRLRMEDVEALCQRIRINPIETVLFQGTWFGFSGWDEVRNALQDRVELKCASFSLNEEFVDMKMILANKPALRDLRLSFKQYHFGWTEVLAPSFHNLTHVTLNIDKKVHAEFCNLLEALDQEKLLKFKLMAAGGDDAVFNRCAGLLTASKIEHFSLEFNGWTDVRLRDVMELLPGQLRTLGLLGMGMEQVSDEIKGAFATAVLQLDRLASLHVHPNLGQGEVKRRLKRSAVDLRLVGEFIKPAEKKKKGGKKVIEQVSRQRRDQKLSGDGVDDVDEMLNAHKPKKKKLTKAQRDRLVKSSGITTHAGQRMTERDIRNQEVLRTLERGVVVERSREKLKVKRKKRTTVIVDPKRRSVVTTYLEGST